MITCSIDGAVATVVLDRPPVNAVDEMWIERFDQVLDQVESAAKGANGLSVLRLRSALTVFSAGADLKMVRRMMATADGRDALVAVIGRLQRLFERIERLSVITVAELAGVAVGGGFELALACDLRVAGENAQLGLPEAGLGLLPAAGGTQRLTRLCGPGIARRLILGAEVVDGVTAADLGLVHWAVPADRLQAWTRDLVRRLSVIPADAIAAAKACIDAALRPDADGFALELDHTRRLYAAVETQARVAAFVEKRR
jgi:enoyl-CoA hydratase/carnithine racemase